MHPTWVWLSKYSTKKSGPPNHPEFIHSFIHFANKKASLAEQKKNLPQIFVLRKTPEGPFKNCRVPKGGVFKGGVTGEP